VDEYQARPRRPSPANHGPTRPRPSMNSSRSAVRGHRPSSPTTAASVSGSSSWTSAARLTRRRPARVRRLQLVMKGRPTAGGNDLPAAWSTQPIDGEQNK